MVEGKKNEEQTKKPMVVKETKEVKKSTDHYGLGESFMKMSDILFGKGWNKT